MGSRLESDDNCIVCGNPIIELNPKLRMCSACEKKVTKDGLRRIANRKSPTHVKRYKIKLPRLAGIIGKK